MARLRAKEMPRSRLLGEMERHCQLFPVRPSQSASTAPSGALSTTTTMARSAPRRSSDAVGQALEQAREADPAGGRCRCRPRPASRGFRRRHGPAWINAVAHPGGLAARSTVCSVPGPVWVGGGPEERTGRARPDAAGDRQGCAPCPAAAPGTRPHARRALPAVARDRGGLPRMAALRRDWQRSRRPGPRRSPPPFPGSTTRPWSG